MSAPTFPMASKRRRPSVSAFQWFTMLVIAAFIIVPMGASSGPLWSLGMTAWT